MSGGSSSSHCKGSSAFHFDPTMSGSAHVNVSGAHTGNNNCDQSGSSTGGHGSGSVTVVPALLNLQSGSITINPNMSGWSDFNGKGPMVTGKDNNFGLQNLGIHIGSLDAGNGGTIYQGTVKGDFGIDRETAGAGGVIVQGSNGLQNLGIHIGDLTAGFGGTIDQGTVNGNFGIDRETAGFGGLIT